MVLRENRTKLYGKNDNYVERKRQFCFQSGFVFEIDKQSAICGITSAKRRCTDRALLTL